LTGASGLVGTRLTELMSQKGYRISHLGRSKKKGTVPSFVWDVGKRQIDPEALKGVDAIIHLAGAGVAEKRWTEKRKKEILESRTQSSALLFDTLKKTPNAVKTFVSASAIGYYGFGFEKKDIATEDTPPGDDFLSRVVVAWEDEVSKISTLGIRVARIRIGIVLSEKGGALVEMAAPIKLGVGSPLGTGNQILPWIHLDDLCGIFIKAIEDPNMQGAFNAVGPNPATNREMTKAIAKVLRKPLWAPPVPGFVLRMILGQMSEIVVNGRNVSAKKIEQAGYKFRFAELEPALRELFRS
jgi:uncharacterized protein (TIGR01777 family)